MDSERHEHMESTCAWVRLRAADVLGDVESQAQVVKTSVKLLENKKAPVRAYAVAVLGGLGPSNGATEAVLPALIKTKTDVRRVLDHFQAVKADDVNLPTSEVSKILAKALKPSNRDSDHRKALRDVLFRWIWNDHESVG